MSPDDEVIYLADPWLHGLGTIDRVLKDGRLLVVFGDEEAEAIFDAHELERFDLWLAKQPNLAEALRVG